MAWGVSIEQCPGGENGEQRGILWRATQSYAITAIGKLKNDPGLVLTPRKEMFLPTVQAES